MPLSKISLATLNTLGTPFQVDNLILRYAAIASFFDTSDIDVLHFQEIFSYAHLYVLKRKLKSYKYCIYKKSYLGSKGGLVIFSRIPVEFVKYVGFTKKHVGTFKRSILESLFTKGMLIAKIKNSNQYLINVHLNAVYDGDWSENTKFKERLSNQIDQFNNELLNLPQGESVTLISGDFNTAKESKFYDQLIKSPLIHDIFGKSNKPTFHSEFLPKNRKNNCIDYIFIFGTKKNYFVLDRKRIFEEMVSLNSTLRNFASDHIGLQVTIELTNY